MVRRVINDHQNILYRQSPSATSYSITPIPASETLEEDLNVPAGGIGYGGIATQPANSRRAMSTSSDSSDEWGRDDSPERTEEAEPSHALKAGNEKSLPRPPDKELPPILRVGPQDGTPRSSFESQDSGRGAAKKPATVGGTQLPNASNVNSTNPFLQKRSTGDYPAQQDFVEESNANPWIDVPKPPSSPPSERPPECKQMLPAVILPSHNTKVDADVPTLVRAMTQPIVPPPEPPAFSEPWMTFETSPTDSIKNEPMGTSPKSHPSQLPPSSADPWAQNEKLKLGRREPLPAYGESSASVFAEQPSGPQELDGRQQRKSGSIASGSHSPNEKRLPPFPPHTQQGTARRPSTSFAHQPAQPEDIPPELPPRTLTEIETPPPKPPRPQDKRSAGPDTPQTGSKIPKQRSETYQIRLVNWVDASMPARLRKSPVMVQNANGPCPLLALVNALVLSTPVDTETALVETLRVREQVSLGLLLDAVIDELMSGRRGDGTTVLPDVSELYAFLVNLHTGMNVNPRFVSGEERVSSLLDAPIPESTGPLSGYRKPGGFEQTREMNLYSAFSVPLIHGWIPPRNHPAFASLNRSAKTYEEAQNIMFREEELDEKLHREGLTSDEQLMLEDIGSIKYFLSSSATQLTGYGLDTITESLTPGSIAILFRNDHFSTLYRHPRSGQLLTLVTDMGYAGHDEVVWESLVDVSGEGCEFYSGDFRPVSNGTEASTSQPSHAHAPSGDSADWTTVTSPRTSSKRFHRELSSREQLPMYTPPPSNAFSALALDDAPPTSFSPNHEQEDHDLALAMQLQEEEEERSRNESAARRREEELSRNYLDLQEPSARRGPPLRPAIDIPNPLVNPRGSRLNRSTDSEDAPPPSYEQAATKPPYHPPANHPAHPNAKTGNPGSSNSSRVPSQGIRARQTSAYTQNSSAIAASTSPPTLHSNPRRSTTGRVGMSQGRGGYGVGGGEGLSRRRSAGSGVPLGSRPGVPVEDDDRRECVVM